MICAQCPISRTQYKSQTRFETTEADICNVLEQSRQLGDLSDLHEPYRSYVTERRERGFEDPDDFYTWAEQTAFKKPFCAALIDKAHRIMVTGSYPLEKDLTPSSDVIQQTVLARPEAEMSSTTGTTHVPQVCISKAKCYNCISHPFTAIVGPTQ